MHRAGCPATAKGGAVRGGGPRLSGVFDTGRGLMDGVLVEALRIEYTTLESLQAAHTQIFQAWRQRIDRVQVIVSKGNEGSSASGQVVVDQKDYRDWLEALQALIREKQAAAAGTGTVFTGTEHVDFSRRYVEP